MKGDKPDGMPESPLHVHHGIRHTCDVDWGDVEDLHSERGESTVLNDGISNEPLVERAPQNSSGAEFLLESDKAHGGSHLVVCLGIL